MSSKCKLFIISILYIGFISGLSVDSFSQKKFTDVTKQSGIDHVFEVFEGFLGGGACVIDYNNDGWEDVYITSGMGSDRLYRNNKNGTFSDVFIEAGLLTAQGYVTQGVIAADVNKDGFRDLFITTIAKKGARQQIPRAENLLYINNKNGTFSNATIKFGLQNLNSFSTGAAFGDVNADGFPDLFVGNYFNQYDGPLNTITDATVVGANQISEAYLLINIDGKKFENQYKDYGLNHRGFGFGGVFSDFDNDGDQDLIVNHDFGYKRTPNILYENLYPRKKFKDISLETAMDLKINSMGTAAGDYDNDGLQDYLFTNIRFNYFLKNQGQGKPFVNKTKEAGLDYLSISWGSNFADFDQDGDLDLFIANGDLNPNCVPMANFFYENMGNGKFEDHARLYGINDYGIGRGSVVFDMDNDGDLDILEVNQVPVLDFPTESLTRLFRNDLSNGNWLKIKLKGKKFESNGIGTKVIIETEGQKFMREIDGGGTSHLSQSSQILHFGLGKINKVKKITIIWPDDNIQVIENINVNQVVNVEEKINANSNIWIFIAIIAVALFITFLFYVKNKK